MFILLYAALSQTVFAQLAEVVWFEEDKAQYHIYIGHYDGESWRAPEESVYHSDNSLNSPTLATSASGDTWLIWSERLRLKTVLMFKRAQRPPEGTAKNLVWSDAQILLNYGHENLAPSLVFDSANIGWLFWSSSGSGLADIYLSKASRAGWSKPIKVNKNNKVPDIVPVASMKNDGTIEVQWTTYDLQLGQYKLDSRRYLIETSVDSPASDFLLEDDSYSSMEIPLPMFVPSDRRVILHLPNNRLIQTVSLTQ